MRTLVIGLGNPILTDDGVGVLVAWEVEKRLEEAGRSDIDVTEASVGGLRLMELMVGYDRVILVDALTGASSQIPGTIHHLTLEDLREISPTQHSTSAHDTSVVTALALGEQMGLHLPGEVSIYAVEVVNIVDFSEQPTPAVAAAIPYVTSAVLEELGVEYGIS